MTATLRQDDPLRAFLSGKRGAPRLDVTLPVVVRGASSEIPGETVDLSEGGTLLAVRSSAMGEMAESELGYLRFVDEQWSDGFDIAFPNEAIVVEATLVRMAPRGEDDVLFLGCRFSHELSKAQQRRLGLRDDEPALGQPEAAPTQGLPFVARDVPVSALLYTDDAHGPRFIGSLVAAGGQAMALEIDGVPMRDVRNALGDSLCVDIRIGKRLLWSTPAEVAGVRFLDKPGGCVEVALVGKSDMPRRLRKHLSRR